MSTNGYIHPSQATRIRVFYGFEGFEIDAADESGNHTAQVWSHWGDKIMTKEVAIEHVKDFAFEIGRPDLVSTVYVSGQPSSSRIGQLIRNLFK